MSALLGIDRWIRVFVVALAPTLTTAHPGGLDDNGGHVDRATGAYHCHDPECVEPVIVRPEASRLDVVSFNIQFLGHFKDRDNTALAALLTPFDIAVVQELVAPPFAGTGRDAVSARH